MQMVPLIVQMVMRAVPRTQRATTRQVGVADAVVVVDVVAVGVVAIRRKTMLKVVVKTRLKQMQSLRQRLHHQLQQRHQQRQRHQPLVPNSVQVQQLLQEPQ